MVWYNMAKAKNRRSNMTKLHENLIKIAKAIALANGQQCETVVHNEKLQIIYIDNGYISNRTVGHIMDESVFKYLDDKARANGGIVVRLTRKSNGEMLKSTTIMCYDEAGVYEGMLCFTQNLTAINQARNLLDSLMNVHPFEDHENDGTNMSIVDYTHMVISDIIKDVGKPSTLGSKEIKLRILRKLDEKGVFLLKDSVPQVCELLDISQATLYNYLREIRSKDTPLIPVARN